ncbi:Transcriptional activator of maltose regulon, MalT [Candidatus Rhodobacter oscarellae]|uniref:Transcriptional activator of maltose regulon, MalT n=1 Tax=Candidatus Rhodobacter oscarellae TaxID=1675527 RepID=A0A0J9E2Z9_9RHOB|nr:DUF2927 domain-containing protein [Candidatus Rhodobacter lobularis]KMW57082.1 Transcriptional activator of maltose regulon, MalT [Candidatus Rhodobacter lobularis]
MRAFVLVLAGLLLSACAASIPDDTATRSAPLPSSLPPMKLFSSPQIAPPSRFNAAIARDFLDLAFELESGRKLPVLTRFEGPISVRVTGAQAQSLRTDLTRLLQRLRREAGLNITQVERNQEASITIQVLSRAELQRYVPQAACFVVPRISSWEEFKRNRRGAAVDWTTLQTRERMAIFLPGDVAPQEIRDCLHEELAQAIGPLNDLYRLGDSVFNDDNFHTVLTGFDMLILRAYYAPELKSGMTREQVAARIPSVLARLNPRGQKIRSPVANKTPRAWIDAIETALGPKASDVKRRDAARRAIEIARVQQWTDNRMAFSLFALGRLSLAGESDIALASFLQANTIYSAGPGTRLQSAHVAMQLAAFALSSGQTEAAIRLVDENTSVVARAENAALLATLFMIKAEALALQGRTAEARAIRQDSLGWARYGFGSEKAVRARLREIAGLSQRLREGRPS